MFSITKGGPASCLVQQQQQQHPLTAAPKLGRLLAQYLRGGTGSPPADGTCYGGKTRAEFLCSSPSR